MVKVEVERLTSQSSRVKHVSARKESAGHDVDDAVVASIHEKSGRARYPRNHHSDQLQLNASRVMGVT
jgi:hypothetical protein